MPSHAPLRLIASVRSQSASSVDSTVPRGLMPAQLTRRSRPPHRETERRHHAVPVAGLGHVEMLADRLESLSAQLGGRLLEQFVLDIGEHDLVRGRGQ